MTNTSTVNKRILRNTLLLYFRQILVMLVGLFTVRVVLKTLGAEDYGINSVVAGTVTMFGFLTGAMATASQRFFSYNIGLNNEYKLKKVFSVTLTIYGLMALLIVVFAETIGLWFVNTKLNIPIDRMPAARWIYQFSILSFVVSIMSAPYMAAIIAHENMSIYAKASILEAILKLLIVYILTLLSYDKLILYGLLLLIVAFINTSVYTLFCVRNYKECHFQFCWDSLMLKEIAGFSFWNLFGNVAWIIKNQGISFLLNIYFGPLLNAAQNIASQVRNITSTFSSNFTTAVRPQIIKQYATQEYDKMFKLTFQSSKFSFYLMLILVLPLFFNLDFLLNIWLSETPPHAVVFSKFLLIETLFDTISTPMAAVNQATGRIKLYQFLIGIIGILNLPLSYLALKLGMVPDIVFVIGIILQCFIVLVRIVFLGWVKKGIIKRCFLSTVVPCAVVFSITMIVCWSLYIPSSNILFICGEMALEVIVAFLVIILLGLTSSERIFVWNTLKQKCKLSNK